MVLRNGPCMVCGFLLLTTAWLSAADMARLPAHGPYFPCDDRIIEDRWQVERFVVPLQRHPSNPLLVKEHVWEGTGPLMQGSVLFDPQDRRFKLWYLVWDEQAYREKKRFSYNVCYAESQDGLLWKKPKLGLFIYRDDAANNLIKLGRNKTQGIDVELNPKPRSAEDRLIAIHNDSGGVFLSASTDGKTFACDFQHPALCYHSDTHNNFVYDEEADRWLMYVRPRAYAGNGLKDVGRRRVAVKASKELMSWTAERTILVPEEGDVDYFYGMTVFRCGDLFWGALQRYETKSHHIDCELVWSPDGYQWQRLPAAAQRTWLSIGEKNSWDGGMVFLADRPVQVGDELRFYYGALDLPHDRTGHGAIGLATTPINRLVAVQSKAEQNSRLLTRPFTAKGDLFINANASGEIRVEVTTLNDEPLPGWSSRECTPFTGDRVEQKVTWGEHSLAELHGKILRLRFHLDQAILYSFEIK